MAAPAVQIAAALMPQHISDRVLMFILTDPLAAQAAARLSKAWRKCILSNFRGPLCLSAIIFKGESEQRVNITSSRYTTRLSKFTALAELDARDQEIADADLKALGFLVPTLETISGCQRGYEYKLVVTSWLAGRPKSWRKLPSRYASSAPLPSRAYRPRSLCPLS